MIRVSEKGLDHVAEKILSYLDAKSLREAELVCKEWHRVIADGLLWKKLIERKVRTDPLWRGLSERKGWYVTPQLVLYPCSIAMTAWCTGTPFFMWGVVV